ncbi:peptidase inhibitor family I36 protein [Nakamurella sp. A5-74]|uniref:Peptidase inhibitor family I36 protein n=1 Tax=Nakamurella sp. A5-74 TaxID=3158264 RepID=A0AAU8DRR3_9ACTN
MTETLAPTSRSRSRRRVAGLLGALAAGLLMPVITAAPAQAATARNGVCESGEFCYYYNSDNAGSVSDFSSSVPDLGATQPSCYDFKSSGAGQGVCVKNHAASVRNRTGGKVTVYFNSGYGGQSQTIASGADANLVTGLKNENASHLFAADDGTWTQAFIVREENRSGFSAGSVTAYQAANIKFIIAVGKGYGISAKGIQTAIATTIVESWAYNRYVITDADSGGLFQQRPASGWGTYSQVRNKFLATKAFYGVASHTSNPGLKDFDYNSYSIGAAAQKVQRSAYPDRYQAQASTAISLYNQYQASVQPYTG